MTNLNNEYFRVIINKWIPSSEKSPECKFSSKNKLTKTKFQNELHRLTSDELSFPTQVDLADVARHSFIKQDCEVLLKHIFKRLQSPSKKWRKIVKTLSLIDVLLARGSKKSVFELKNKVFLVQNLSTFTFHDGPLDRGAKSELISPRPSQRPYRRHKSSRPKPLQRIQ